MKPGKILVEDDEGKVSMDRLSREAGPSQCPHPHKGSEPLPPLVLFPNTRWGACMAGQRGGSRHGEGCNVFLGGCSYSEKANNRLADGNTRTIRGVGRSDME